MTKKMIEWLHNFVIYKTNQFVTLKEESMKKFRSVLALVLAVLTVLPFAACGGGEGVGTQTETESETEGGVSIGDLDADVSDYLTAHSDYDAAKEWLKENIEDSNTPPVIFKIGKKFSYEYEWTKTVGEPTTVTDFAASDKPVKRSYYDIVYTNTELGFEITLTLTSYPNYPVVEYDAKIKNLNTGNSPEISSLQSISSDIMEAKSSVVHYNDGGYYAETCFQAKTETVSGGKTFELASEYGMTSMNYLPFLNAENKNDKKGVITAVNWQGDWKVKYKISDGELNLEAGQKSTNFVMFEGETMYYPGIVLLFYKNGDWQYGQNIWRRWIIDHNMMRYSGHRDFKENVYLCSALTGTTADLQAVNAVAKTDIPEKFNCVFELDAPWYDIKKMPNWGYTGEWKPAKVYANGGLKKISDLCHNKGIQFCMWFEPERVYYGTTQSKELGNDNMIYLHTKAANADNTQYWLTGVSYISYDECEKTGFDPGINALINYSKQEAVDYAIDLIDGAIKEYGIDVYRQDFNTNNGPFWWAYDAYQYKQSGVRRTGATENLACGGYIDVWTALAEKNPGLVIDACAGGGRRLDLETLRFSFAHTKSDWNTEVISQQCQNFSAYSWYIFTGTGLMAPSDNYDTRSRLTLSIGVGCSSSTDYKTLEKGLDEWKSLHKYLWNDFYQITELNYDKSGEIAMQFHDHENGEGMMIAYLRAGGLFGFKAMALKPEQNYKVWDGDNKEESLRVMSGKQLMEEGFYVNYSTSKPYAAVVWYEETDEEVTPFDLEGFLAANTGIDWSSLRVAANDTAKLIELYKESGVGEEEVKFICSDYDSSGGIYAIGKKVDLRITTTGKKNDQGWEEVDPGAMYLKWQTYKYPIAQWGIGSSFDVRAYVKSTSGCYFLWFDNSYSLGDSDGGWKNGSRSLVLMRNNKEVLTTEPFEFVVCAYDVLNDVREIQFVSEDADKKGSVYKISEEFYNKLQKAQDTESMYGTDWMKLDYAKAYMRMPKNNGIHNDSDDSYYINMTLAEINKEYNTDFLVAQMDGGYYLWIKNAKGMGSEWLSDRWQLYYVGSDGKILERVTFLSIIPGKYRLGMNKVPNLMKFK
ncbi:MAG: hypothetical protein E7623_03450 [Ruminococcaceae bacterium]|nr:hypothetical protein [Oscillospiraceae bacterium]